MKFINQRPYADPAVAARKLLGIANATEAVQDGRIYILLFVLIVGVLHGVEPAFPKGIPFSKFPAETCAPSYSTVIGIFDPSHDVEAKPTNNLSPDCAGAVAHEFGTQKKS